MGGLTQGSGFKTFTEKVDSLNIKRPVSIKRPGLIHFEKSLLNVPYNLRKYFLKPLTSGTYNRNFRVLRISLARIFENMLAHNFTSTNLACTNLFLA